MQKYTATPDGIVFNESGKELAQHIRHGYARVKLYDRPEGGYRRVQVHRLVAEAFVENPKRHRFVNHKDGNKLNNHYSNLEWCSHPQNMKHAHETGLQIAVKGENHGRSKLSEKDVHEIKRLLSQGISCRKIAKIFDMSSSAIDCIKAGKTWKHIK